MLKKAKIHFPLSHWEKKFNKLIGQTSYKVERTFGSIRRWFGGAVARYSGTEKVHTKNLMEAMSCTFISKYWDHYVQFSKKQQKVKKNSKK